MSFVKEIVLNATSLSKITVNTALNTANTNFTLIDVEGWLELPNIRRNTSSILWQDGQSQSTNALYSERVITVRFFAEYPNNVNVELLRQNILVMANDLNNLYELHYNTYEGLDIVRKEVLFGRPSGNFVEWEQTDNKVEVALEFVCPNPKKVVYLNGSVTPEAGEYL